MHPRDLFALLLSVVAVYIALQREGGIEFRPAWFHPIDEPDPIDDELENYARHHFPRPVVADLNGDGRPEVLVATSSGRIQIVSPERPGRPGEGFTRARLMADVAIAATVGDDAPDDMRPIALSAGFLDPDEPPVMLAGPPSAPRKMVVAVATAGGTVLCFDHNLRPLWSKRLQPDGLPEGTFYSEAALLVSPQRVMDHDRGAVLVGLALERGDSIWGGGGVEVQPEMPRGDDWNGATLDGVDGSREMALVAMDGGSGHVRWTHDSASWLLKKDVVVGSERVLELETQLNYKLTAEEVLRAENQGGRGCGAYKQSVEELALPHRWSWMHDSSLHLAKVHRTKQAHVKESQKVESEEKREKPPGSLVSSALKNVHDGLTSGAKGSLTPLPEKAKGHHHAEVAPGESTKPSKEMNAVVAHTRDGIEVVEVATGRPICSMVLAARQMHADVNMDGVLDHIWSAGETDARPTGFERSASIHASVNRCWGYVTSGSGPSMHKLFDGTLCRFSRTGALSHVSKIGAVPNHAPVEVATPTILPVPKKGAPSFLKFERSLPEASQLQDILSVFLNSRGEMVAYTSKGRRAWEIYTEAWWVNHPGVSPVAMLRPTLTTMTLVLGVGPYVVLAAGTSNGAVVSASGSVLSSFEIPVPPIQPLRAADYDGDGLTDIMVISQDGIYGFTQVVHAGALPFRALVGILGVSLVLVYFTHASAHGGLGARGIKKM